MWGQQESLYAFGGGEQEQEAKRVFWLREADRRRESRETETPSRVFQGVS